MLKLRPILLTLVILACPKVFAQTYDVIIRGGHVIDGTGNPWIKADVGIRAGRIVRVGRIDDAQASRIIDATEQVVTPGFIDMHTHSEYTLLYDGNAQSNIRQGATTEVVGEDTSPGPIHASVLSFFPDLPSIPNVFRVQAPCNSDIGGAFNDRTAVGKYG